MEPKKIGIIALVVVGIALAGWSFRSAFMGGPETHRQDSMEQMKASQQKLLQSGGGDQQRMPGQPAHTPK